MASRRKNKQAQKRSLNSDVIAQRIADLKESMRKPLPPPVQTHANKKRKALERLSRLDAKSF
jgi:hypothetical protein